jgi:hypothetical protein
VKVPALVNVNENVPPPDWIALESHDTAEPESLEDVCATVELLIHSTVSPTLTVTDEGEKPKLENEAPTILTVAAGGLLVAVGAAVVAVAAGGATVAVGALLVVPLAAPQAASVTIASNETYRPPRDAIRASGVHLTSRARNISVISS